MKKMLALLLAFIMIAAFVPSSTLIASAASTYTTHVFMVYTNPGENCNTQMNINFFSDWDYTKCFVEYTLADDTEYADKKTATTKYNDEVNEWFYGHSTTMGGTSPFNKKVHDWDVCLKNLVPDTEYIYRVCDGNGMYTKDYHFKTSGADEFSILWLSDAHVFSSYPQRLKDWVATYDYIKEQAKYPIGFQFSTGDTVACGDKIKDWMKVAEQDFISDMMFANVNGNHDVYDSVMTKDPNYVQYWKSSEYFKYVFNNPKNAYTHTSQRLVAYLANDKIADPDGSKSFEDVNGKSYWFLYNRCLFIVFDYWAFNYSYAEVLDSFNWASKVIKENEGNYDYLICTDHLNLINGGGGGSRYYYEKYMSFLDENNVDMFLAGDNHVYLRTGKLLGGSITDDPSKGTYIIQAPCISRAQSFSAKGAAGFALEQYSLASSENGGTVGGIVIDFDKNGMTFSCYVRENGEYYKYDSYTVPKKERHNKIQAGRYETPSELELKASPSTDSDTYTTIPADNPIDIIETVADWGKVYYKGYTGWIETSGMTKKTGLNAAPKIPVSFKADTLDKAVSASAGLQIFTPAFGKSVVASGTVIAGTKDANGVYTVSASKPAEVPANGVIISVSPDYANKDDIIAALSAGKKFLLDTVNKTIYVKADESASWLSDDLILKDGCGAYIDGQTVVIPVGTNVSFLKEAFYKEPLLKNAKSEEIADGKPVGTGAIAAFGKTEAVFVVKGDTDGNGKIDSTDYIMIKRHILNVNRLDGAFIKSADMDSNNKIDSTDYISVKRIMLGLA